MSFFNRQLTRKTLLTLLGLATLLTLTISTPTAAQQATEAGKGNSGGGGQSPQGNQDVWSTILDNKRESPFTGDSSGSGNPEEQDEQRLCFGGHCDYCGLQKVKATDFLPKLCKEVYPKMSSQQICTQPESAKRCMIAAQVYSIPSSVILCAWGARTNSDAVHAGEEEKKAVTMTEEQAKAEDKHIEEANKNYEKLVNGANAKKDAKMESKDADFVCRDQAADARRFMDAITPAYWNSNFLHNGESACDYLKFAALIVINQKLGADVANKLVQAGENGMKLTGKALNDMKPIIDGMIDCMGKIGSSSQNAPDKMVKGSCKSESIYN